MEVLVSMTPPAPYGSFRRPVPYPKLTRPQSGRVVAGVATGLSQHLRVDVLWVRVALSVLSLFSGAGVLAYVGLWMTTKATGATGATNNQAQELSRNQLAPSRYAVPRAAYYAIAAAAVVAALTSISLASGLSPAVLVPLAVVAAGALIAWLAYDRGMNTPVGIASIAFGALLVIAGVVVTALSWDDNGGFAPAVAAVLLTFAGIAVLVVPLILKLWRSLADEKAAKAASEERTQMASRLHDSVLQTLALIQKRADDPAEVARLARGQERELRTWLFDAPATSDMSIFTALEAACGEVEDLFGLRIVPVTVGEDAPLSDATKLAVQAAREAMVNAGKHAGVGEIDVYAENLAGELTIFIRDRGKGFDVDTVDEDRHGIRDSIRARMASVGGRSRISSTPGEGTEVEVAVALEQ